MRDWIPSIDRPARVAYTPRPSPLEPKVDQPRKGHFSHVKTDLAAGLVVFLIALPLCLGISLASGAPLFAGIISGIVVGVVVGFFSRSSINVSGPAASVAIVVLSAITTLGFKAVLAATIVAGVMQIGMGYARAGTIAYFFPFFSTPDFSAFLNPAIYSVAASIAFIASLESLLSTEAGDKLDPYKRKTSTNDELRAQGIGNIVAGLIGGLPVTAVIVRTSANVTAGGRTPLSTITHGTLMFICVLLIPRMLNLIPLSSLAAVLFVVGYRLTSPRR